MIKSVKKSIKSGFLKGFVSLIKVYQRTISPDHGWARFLYPKLGCKFYPSCSEYTKQAAEHYGVVQGLWLGFKRLGRCHPFSAGGFDPIK